jgi:hypothetical protein
VDDALAGAPAGTHLKQTEPEVRGRYDFGRRLGVPSTIYQLTEPRGPFLI